MHTPLPWVITMSDMVIGANQRKVADCEKNHYTNRPQPPDQEDMDNAVLIVKAVNSYEAMRDALTNLVEDWERVHGALPRDHEAINALALAEGKDGV